MSEASDKSIFTFWSTLENIIRPQVKSVPAQPQNAGQANQASQATSQSGSENSTEKIIARLNNLKCTEPIQNRLKTLEELIKSNDLPFLNEELINILLQNTRDLFKTESTQSEYRKLAFDYLMQLYLKQSEKFDTFMLKNHLLCLIINHQTSKCLFLNTISAILSSDTVLQNSRAPSHKSIVSTPVFDKPEAIKLNLETSDDIKQKFNLFILVTKNGTNCRNFDPEMTSECLIFFLQNFQHLNENGKQLFELFKNIIAEKKFQYLDEKLLVLLTGFILNFSYVITKNASAGATLSPQQLVDIRNCVELIDKLISHVTTIECVNHIVLSLCELLNLVRLGQTNDNTTTLFYDCMNKLFVSSIGNCAIFTFFNEVFPPHKKNQSLRSHQINGALLHIKQLFEEFRQMKFRNTYLIKELHLNCLVHLPSALKSCCNEVSKAEQQIIFENILNLAIELVNLATHRDLFMCLLTFNSRKFFIEIIDQFSVKIQDNKKLIQKYAELISLLDKKEVFNYMTGTSNDEVILLYQKFKESFYELVYKFPDISYLSDQCINNCIEFYLQRKYLPCYNADSIAGIRFLLDKFFRIKNNKKIWVRKFVLEALIKRLNEYQKIDQKIFAVN